MKVIILIWTLIALLSAQEKSALTIGQFGGLERLSINGNQTFSDEDIIEALQMQYHLVQQDQPDLKAELFYEEVRNLITRGYLASGFPDNKVSLTLEKDTAAFQIVEGPGYRNGEIIFEYVAPLPETIKESDLENAIRFPSSEQMVLTNEDISSEIGTSLPSSESDLFEKGLLTDFSQETVEAQTKSLREAFAAGGYYSCELALSHKREKETAHLVVKIGKVPAPQKIGKITFDHEVRLEVTEHFEKTLKPFTGQPATANTLASMEKLLNQSFQFRHLAIRQELESETNTVNVLLNAIPWKKAWPIEKELSQERSFAHLAGQTLHEIFEHQRDFGFHLKVDRLDKTPLLEYRLGRQGNHWGLSLTSHKNGSSRTSTYHSRQPLGLANLRFTMQVTGNQNPEEKQDGVANFGIGIGSKGQGAAQLAFHPIFFWGLIADKQSDFLGISKKGASSQANWQMGNISLKILADTKIESLHSLSFDALKLPGNFSANLTLSNTAPWLKSFPEKNIAPAESVHIFLEEGLFIQNVFFNPENKNFVELGEDFQVDKKALVNFIGELFHFLSAMEETDSKERFFIPTAPENRSKESGTYQIALSFNRRLNELLPAGHRWRNFFRETARLSQTDPIRQLYGLAMKAGKEESGPIQLLLMRKLLMSFSRLPKAISAEIALKQISNSKIRQEINEMYEFLPESLISDSPKKANVAKLLASLEKVVNQGGNEMDFSSPEQATASVKSSKVLAIIHKDLAKAAEGNPISFLGRQAPRYKEALEYLALYDLASADMALGMIAAMKGTPEEALKHYRTAAQKGHAKAAYSAGTMCELKAIDDAAFKKEALQHYQHSLKLGYQKARKKIEELEKEE